MGVRLNMAIGYGILIDGKDGKTWKQDEIHECLKKYFDEWLEFCIKINKMIKQGDAPQKKDFSEEEGKDLLTYLSLITIIDIKKSRNDKKLVFNEKNGKRRTISDLFAFPNAEFGTGKFFGYVKMQRYGDEIDHSIAYSMGKQAGEPFEILLPIVDMDLAVEVTRNGKVQYAPLSIPSELIMTTLGKEGIEKLFFDNKEDCIQFITMKLKEKLSMESPHYKRGLELVRLFYPEIQLKDIERYLVGWWS